MQVCVVSGENMHLGRRTTFTHLNMVEARRCFMSASVCEFCMKWKEEWKQPSIRFESKASCRQSVNKDSGPNVNFKKNKVNVDLKYNWQTVDRFRKAVNGRQQSNLDHMAQLSYDKRAHRENTDAAQRIINKVIKAYKDG